MVHGIAFVPASQLTNRGKIRVGDDKKANSVLKSTVTKERVPLGRHKVNSIHKKGEKGGLDYNIGCIT